MISKLIQLLALIPRRPREFCARVWAIAEVQADKRRKFYSNYRPTDWYSVLQQLSEFLSIDVDELLAEPELRQIEEVIRRGIQDLPSHAPFNLVHNGDYILARLCYVTARILRPNIVLETGVCYGVTSAFLLAALEKNCSGSLCSVDLPPLGQCARQFVGCLVPESIRHRWHLHRGTSRALLAPICKEAQQIDLFVHDSLHTYSNMRSEFALVRPFLGPQAAVIADDIQGNSAFGEWVSETNPAYVSVMSEQSKRSMLGFALIGAPSQIKALVGSRSARTSVSTC